MVNINEDFVSWSRRLQDCLTSLLGQKEATLQLLYFNLQKVMAYEDEFLNRIIPRRGFEDWRNRRRENCPDGEETKGAIRKREDG